MTSLNTCTEGLNTSGQLSTDLTSTTVQGQEGHIVSDVRTTSLCDVPPEHCAASGEISHCVEHQSEFLPQGYAHKQLEADRSLKLDNTYKPGNRFITINTLPDEMLLKIFSFMSFSELIDVVSVVCTHWKRVAQDAKLWYDKVFVVRDVTYDKEVVRTFRMVPQLRTVVTERKMEAYVFHELSTSCTELTTLDICRWQKLSYSELENLFERCSKIQTLKIPRRLLADTRFIDAVTKLKHLRSLHLKEYRSENCQLQLRVLADECPHLCEIVLAGMYYETEDMEYFVNTKKDILKHISTGWTSVSRRCIVPVLTVCANNLEHLELSEYDVPDVDAKEVFRALGQLHNLRELIFNVWGVYPKGMFPQAFNGRGLSKLQLLHIFHGWNVQDEAIIAISQGCPSLHELWLHSCRWLTDRALTQIHQLEQLEILKFTNCKRLRGAAIPCIAKLPSLHTLHFTGMKLEKLQPGLECILDISSLRRLEIHGSIVRPIPFDRFPAKLVNLRELYLGYCEGDQSILDEVCAQMPELQVDGKLHNVLQYTDNDSDTESYD